MKLRLLLLVLLIPQLAFAYYARRPCCSRLQPCGWWGSADYLLIWRKQRFFPPLVTTNPTLPPALDAPGTRILFGDEFVGGAPKSGFRGDLGIWVSRCLAGGISGYKLGKDQVKFSLDGSPEGLPIFGQPFFNTSSGTQDVNLLSFPALQLNGHIDLQANNRIWGVDLYARYRFLNAFCLKFDLLGGFLYSALLDDLTVNTATTSPVGPVVTVVNDSFAAQNKFYGGLVGAIAEFRSCSWAVNVIAKVGLGSMQRRVEIDGFTSFGMPPDIMLGTLDSGFLAQPSNSGIFKKCKFDVLPQISANLQLKIWSHIWASVGYTYMFWPSVALAGEQVDLNINPEQPIVGPATPVFPDKLTSFWAHGLTAGLYFCY
jgi:hypothetical protein